MAADIPARIAFKILGFAFAINVAAEFCVHVAAIRALSEWFAATS